MNERLSRKVGIRIIGILILFIVTTIAAFFVEEFYQRLVIQLFKTFQGKRIIFFGKDIKFPTYTFCLSVGLFCSLEAILIVIKKNSRFLILFSASLTFFLTTLLTCYLDSESKIITCTTCNDNVLSLRYTDIDYEVHLIMGLLVAFIVSCLVFTKTKPRQIIEESNIATPEWHKDKVMYAKEKAEEHPETTKNMDDVLKHLKR